MNSTINEGKAKEILAKARQTEPQLSALMRLLVHRRSERRMSFVSLARALQLVSGTNTELEFLSKLNELLIEDKDF